MTVHPDVDTPPGWPWTIVPHTPARQPADTHHLDTATIHTIHDHSDPAARCHQLDKTPGDTIRQLCTDLLNTRQQLTTAGEQLDHLTDLTRRLRHTLTTPK